MAPAAFAKQIAILSTMAEPIAVSQIPAFLSAGGSRDRAFCITFDDGYQCTLLNSRGILAAKNVPSTHFISTEFTGQRIAMPFDAWSVEQFKGENSTACLPATWTDWRHAVTDPLITVGSHSHSHISGIDVGMSALTAELSRSFAMLESELGRLECRLYAYPYGSIRRGHVSGDHVLAASEQGVELAFTTEPGLALPKTDPLLVPRFEVTSLDTATTLRAKVHGAYQGNRLLQRLSHGRLPRTSTLKSMSDRPKDIAELQSSRSK